MTNILFIMISTFASAVVYSGFEGTLGKLFLSAPVEFFINFTDKLLSALQQSVLNFFIVYLSFSTCHLWRFQTDFWLKCLLLVLVLHFLFHFFSPWNTFHVHRLKYLSDLLLFQFTAEPSSFFIKISNFDDNQRFFIILNIKTESKDLIFKVAVFDRLFFILDIADNG